MTIDVQLEKIRATAVRVARAFLDVHRAEHPRGSGAEVDERHAAAVRAVDFVIRQLATNHDTADLAAELEAAHQVLVDVVAHAIADADEPLEPFN
ncbi:MAG: hypothetical protein IPH80_33390 [Myxococcales bacterium]|nr:hypothetical protein [Myxococcales bacterium]